MHACVLSLFFCTFSSPAQSTHQEEEWILEAEKCINFIIMAQSNVSFCISDLIVMNALSRGSNTGFFFVLFLQ
jgi:hypothetical protein